MVKEKMTAIADTIRSHTGKTDKLFLDDMPLAIENACAAEYEKGFTAGQAGGGDGYEEGFADGKQAEYDRFWDAYQQNGNRMNYAYGFSGVGWNAETFKPKYDIIPTNSTQGFHSLNRDNADWESFDLVEHLAKLGVVLDFSQSVSVASLFMWAWIGRVGVVDCRSAGAVSLNTVFSHGKIKTIDKVIVNPDQSFTNTFQNNTELTNITFEGTIGNDISFQWQKKLSKASIESIVGHLSDVTTGKTLTLSQTAVDNAFHDPEGEDVIGSASADWNSLMESKPNWTITLV